MLFSVGKISSPHLPLSNFYSLFKSTPNAISAKTFCFTLERMNLYSDQMFLCFCVFLLTWTPKCFSKVSGAVHLQHHYTWPPSPCSSTAAIICCFVVHCPHTLAPFICSAQWHSHHFLVEISSVASAASRWRSVLSTWPSTFWTVQPTLPD